ncbi:MAG: hypothetical protein LBK99_21940 [Opitutaceae bacterium]|jgi:hypothetical protein|nr:hypothetical protein [Opitutaceae bacterium]
MFHHMAPTCQLHLNPVKTLIHLHLIFASIASNALKKHASSRYANANRPSISGFISACLLFLFVTTVAFPAEVSVFSESFTYANQNALEAAWTRVGSGTPGLGSNNNVSGSPYLVLPNSLTRKSLNETISAGSDWTLTFDMIQSNYQRASWVGLFDAEHKKGYVVMWDSGNEDGNSVFRISSYNNPEPISAYDASLTNLVSLSVANNSFNAIFDPNTGTNNDFITIILKWNAAKQELSMGTSIAGTSTKTVTTTEPGFAVSTIFIKGNGNALLDNIQVTAAVPEPGTMAAISGAIVLAISLICTRKHNTHNTEP